MASTKRKPQIPVRSTRLLALTAELKKDYAPEKISPCPVCGHARDRICAAGMGRVTYCCGSEDAQPTGKGDRYEECMDHFGKSRWETCSCDGRILELCGLVEKLVSANALHEPPAAKNQDHE